MKITDPDLWMFEAVALQISQRSSIRVDVVREAINQMASCTTASLYDVAKHVDKLYRLGLPSIEFLERVLSILRNEHNDISQKEIHVNVTITLDFDREEFSKKIHEALKDATSHSH